MKGICIVGFGYWGLKLVRIFLAASAGAVVAVCEDSSDLLLRAKQEFPGVLTFCSFDDALAAPEIEAVALATPVSSHFPCSWVSPVKIRHLLIGGDRKMILYNDLDANEPLRVHESGYEARTLEDRSRSLFDFRAGDVFAPKIFGCEALAALVGDFWDAIKTGRRPVSDGRFGADVVAILECAEKSVRLRGAEVAIL